MSDKVPTLLVGLEDAARQSIWPRLADCDPFEVKSVDRFDEMIQSPPAESCPLVLCGPAFSKYPSTEMAQVLRMLYPGAVIFFITDRLEKFYRKALIDEGFTDAFLVPMDLKYFGKKLDEVVAAVKKLTTYRPVKIIDIQPNTVLDFDVSIYMPVNQHFIKYSSKGDPIDEDRLKKLEDHQYSSLYVAKDDLDKFYRYTAHRLLFLSKKGQPGLSETERRERLEGSVRELVTGIFNPTTKDATTEAGRGILNDTKKIVQEFIAQNQPGDWYKKVLRSMSDTSDAYSHASSVSTLASLLSIGLQAGDPSELAIAGLYHDIGLAEVSDETIKKPAHMRSGIETALYNKHPEMTLNMLKLRKILIPKSVEKAIFQHHERWDGRGFPKKLQGEAICMEAKILGLADQLEYMTQPEKGKARLTPAKAILKLKEDQVFESELLDQVLRLVPEEMK